MARKTLKIGGLVTGGSYTTGRFFCLCSACQAKRALLLPPQRQGPPAGSSAQLPAIVGAAQPFVKRESRERPDVSPSPTDCPDVEQTEASHFDRDLRKTKTIYVRRPSDGSQWWFPIMSEWALTFDIYGDLQLWMGEHGFIYDIERNARRKAQETEVWLRSPNVRESP